MPRRSLPFLAVFTAVMAGAGLSALQQETGEPSFKTDAAELVVLSVTVTDRQGQLVPDLDRDQFAVFDNGAARKLRSSARKTRP